MILRFFGRMKDQVVVEEAESGEEAMERIRGKRFDIVLSDYRMGAVSGIDLLAFARQESPSTIRILLSGYASPTLRDEAVRVADAHAVLEKPMTPVELDLLLQEHVVRSFVVPLQR